MLHHVGIVCDREHDFNLLVMLLELLQEGEEVKIEYAYIPEFQCTCTMVGSIELIVPDGGKLLEWLDEHGTSIHHIAVAVEDVKETSRKLWQRGVRLVTEEPVRGVGGILVNFIHPLEYGIMIELVEERKDD